MVSHEQRHACSTAENVSGLLIYRRLTNTKMPKSVQGEIIIMKF